MTDVPSTRPSPGGGLSQKMMGLPAWGWIAIAAAAGIGITVWMQSRKSSAPDTTTMTDTSGSDDEPSETDQAILAQLRDLQGAVSTPTTTTTTLAAPTNLKFTSVTSQAATLTWSPVSGAVSYIVEWQDKNGKGNTTSYVPTTIHHYQHKLSKGDQVGARVCGVDKAGHRGDTTSIGTTIK